MPKAIDQKKFDFETLMRAHGPMIYTLAMRLTGNSVDAQDLAQTTFVKAYKSAAQFREESEVGTWFYRICVNEWKNRVRYEKRRFFKFHFPWFSPKGDEEVERELERELEHEVAAPEPPAGASLEGMERKAAIQEALSRLGPAERAILVMRDVDDKAYEEISHCLNIPMGTVKSRLARAREHLRVILEPVIQKGL